MTEYLRIPIELDSDEVTEQAFARMQELVPGWEPADGNLDVWQLMVLARMGADLGEIATLVGDDLFRHVGSALFQIAPNPGINATVNFSRIDTNR